MNRIKHRLIMFFGLGGYLRARRVLELQKHRPIQNFNRIVAGGSITGGRHA
ncbi:hypothetical protein UFOVP413_2 [uncultured Caudovirales phage]|uniref:Uncharacterized protein n=1 Tax=uncultured Caudovirales phage TaxID=2100421 RepID=A0A6J5M245_9CAUD|nr:hypothetical protein UFOVP413_2 [uncultured Caudovirales phage]